MIRNHVEPAVNINKQGEMHGQFGKKSAPQLLSDKALDQVSGGIEAHTVRVTTQNDTIGTPDYSIDSAEIDTSGFKLSMGDLPTSRIKS